MGLTGERGSELEESARTFGRRRGSMGLGVEQPGQGGEQGLEALTTPSAGGGPKLKNLHAD